MHSRLTDRTAPPITKDHLFVSQFCPLLFEKMLPSFDLPYILVDDLTYELQEGKRSAQVIYSLIISKTRFVLAALYDHYCSDIDVFDPTTLLNSIKELFEAPAMGYSEIPFENTLSLAQSVSVTFLDGKKQGETLCTLDTVLDQIPDSDITTLSEFLLMRFEEDWWDQIDHLLCKAPLKFPWEIDASHSASSSR